MELFGLQDMALFGASYAGVTQQPQWTSDDPASLTEQLQTSLDLAEQLEIFSMAAGKVLPLRSLQLQTAVGKYLASGSEPAASEHRSMLMLNDQCLAELCYQSEHPVTPMQQHQLWQLERQWLYPLRNTLVVARLQQLALRDSLTSLGNRRHFDDQFAKALQLAHRRHEACALILLDLDNFKRTNDNFGHHAGDDVLLAVADAMRQTLRASDGLFRFGGDEFAVVLSAEDAACAELVAHRLVKAINQHHQCQQFEVTASAGLAQLTPGEQAATLFARADDALAQAKLAGKNAVKVSLLNQA
ncbi:GGDEF domain-containing protein [Rheinheimera sp.]|uniref:GGDEF domain-containing protein n=1 Tax=Rheinheimera sp. TaxID=1869214 RepID=UPI00307D11D0